MFLYLPTKIKYFVAAAATLILAVAFFQFRTKKEIIITVNYSEQARQILQTCRTADTQQCYAKEFSKLAYQQGFQFAIKTLKELQTFDPGARQCHRIAHAISGGAVKRDPAHWQDLLKGADLSMEGCGGGFLHGIIESHLADDPNFSLNPQTITQICGSLEQLAITACAHGFGHVVVFQTNGDIGKASAVCKELNDDLTSECYTGMFMEDAFKDMLFDHGIVAKPASPQTDIKGFTDVQNRCRQFENQDIAGNACWANLGHIIAEFYKHDPVKSFAACQKAALKKQRRGCYFRAISSIVISLNDESKILKLCEPYTTDKNAYNKCAQYIAATLIYHSADYANTAVQYCSKVSDAAKGDCFAVLGFMLSQKMEAQERISVCKNFPKIYVDSCLNPPKDLQVFSLF